MKIRILLIASLCSVLTVVGLRAEESAPAAAPAAQKHEHTELGEHMEKIGGAFRRLGREVADPSKNEDSLKQVATIRTHAEAALKLQPEKTADIPADQRAKFVADYQEKMKSFLADVSKVEAALKDGKNDDAAALVKTLKLDSDEGHKAFQKKKQKKKAS